LYSYIQILAIRIQTYTIQDVFTFASALSNHTLAVVALENWKLLRFSQN